MPSLSHKDDYLETPRPIVGSLETWIGKKFLIDVAASEQNKCAPMFINEDMDALTTEWIQPSDNLENVIFNNPPRSKNKKFVLRALDQWKKLNVDIVQLICWNDLGNKYCDEIRELVLEKKIKIKNLGKIVFWKNGLPTKFPSRLAYLAIWFQKQ